MIEIGVWIAEQINWIRLNSRSGFITLSQRLRAGLTTQLISSYFVLIVLLSITQRLLTYLKRTSDVLALIS